MMQETMNEDTSTTRLSGLQAVAWLDSDQHDDVHATRLLEQSMLLCQALWERTGETNPLVNAARKARTEGQNQRAAVLEEAFLSPLAHRSDTSG